VELIIYIKLMNYHHFQ